MTDRPLIAPLTRVLLDGVPYTVLQDYGHALLVARGAAVQGEDYNRSSQVELLIPRAEAQLLFEAVPR